MAISHESNYIYFASFPNMIFIQNNQVIWAEYFGYKSDIEVEYIGLIINLST